MEGAFGMHRRERRPYVNLTSLIDVLFMLLIFFMLSSTFKNALGVDIVLPHADTAANQEGNPREIIVDAAGGLFFGTRKLSPEELKTELAAIVQAEPNAPLLLRADKHADFQDVLTVIDIARAVGGAQLIIPTSPDTEQTGPS